MGWTDAELEAAYDNHTSIGGGWSDAQLDAAFEAAQPKAAPLGAGETFTGGIGNLLNAMTFGFGDEAVSGVNSVLDAVLPEALGGTNQSISEAYDSRLGQVRDLNSRYRSEHPIASIGTDIVAAAKMPIPSFLGKAATIPGKIGVLAGEGAAYGGLQGVGSSEGGLENRLTGLLEGAESGAKWSAALGTPLLGLEKLLRGAGILAPKIAEDLNRKSIGARQSDYAKTANDLGIIDVPEGDLATLTKASIDDLLSSGKLGESRNPSNLIKAVKSAETEISYDIGKIIKNYDDSGAKIRPNFNGALEYLSSGKVPADKVDTYLNRLEKLDSAIVTEGKGKLSYLQQQKIAHGALWDPNDSALNGFNRAIYNDLQKSIESVAPEVAPLNRELQKFKIVKPIVQRGLAAEEAADPVNKITQAIRTSGGGGVPIIAGTVLGGVPGGIAGLGLAKTQSYLSSPQGKKTLSNLLGKAEVLSKTPSLSQKVPILAGIESGIQNAKKAPNTESTTEAKLKSLRSTTSFNSTLDKALTQAEKQMELKAPQVIEVKRTSSKVLPESFVEKEEGGQQLKAYPPPAKGSGVTVASGVDLGQWSKKDLEDAGVSPKTILKVSKYLGAKDATARKLLKEKPLTLKQEEADELDNAIKEDIYGTVEKKLSDKGVTLAKLPEEAQAVVKSLAWNFGKNIDDALPTIWKAITQKDWAKVQDLLVNTKWKQPELVERRKREAELLSALV